MIDILKVFLDLTADQVKSEVVLKQKDHVFYLILNRRGNAFNKDFVRAINSKLDIVEKHEGSASLVAVSGGKLFSGGLDLSFMTSLAPEDGSFFVLEVIQLYGRLLAFNCPTFCLVKGAAFAGGCMLAFCFDQIHVFQNASFCCNEVELGVPLPPGMNAVIQRKINHQKDFRDIVLYAKKFSAEDGVKAGFVDNIIQDKPLETIHELAEQKSSFAIRRSNFKKLREEMNKNAIDCCFNKQHAGGVRGEISSADSPFSKL